MKLLAVLVELPYPANHGARCDIARRLEAFQELGWDVHAITWTGGRLEAPIREADIARMNSVVADLELLKLDRGARRVLNMLRWPSQAAGRWPSRAERERLLQKYRSATPGFDAIWIDGIHAAPLGRWLADQLGVPYFYRSHNIEYRYNAEQASLATGLNKLSVMGNLAGLKRLETSVLRGAALFYDISFEDLATWRAAGFDNGRLLSTMADRDMLDLAKRGTDTLVPSDIAFTGSLSLPNNVAALEWYLSQVHPKVIAKRPQTTLVVAGRNPSSDLSARVAAAGGELIANPEHMEPILLGCEVAINPILHGSGVNVKMIDMLASGRRVVSTSIGTRGLPPEIVELVAIADDADGMAEAIVTSLAEPEAQAARDRRIATVSRHFGLVGFRQSLAEAETIVARAF